MVSGTSDNRSAFASTRAGCRNGMLGEEIRTEHRSVLRALHHTEGLPWFWGQPHSHPIDPPSPVPHSLVFPMPLPSIMLPLPPQLSG